MSPRFGTPTAQQLLDWMSTRIGYGNLSAPYWFIGLEEGTGNALGELAMRVSGGQLQDLEEAHRVLPSVHTKFFGHGARLQSTWRGPMLTLLSGSRQPHTPKARRIYQRTQLGRRDGETLLAELLPLPCPAINNWPYHELRHIVSELSSRKSYEHAWLDRRKAFLRSLIAKHQPAVVLAYGKCRWSDYRDLFSQRVRWSAQADGWSDVGVDRVSSTIVALTPHPARTANARWTKLGERIKSLRLELTNLPSLEPIHPLQTGSGAAIGGTR